jgi:hypothetical protein
MLSHLPRWKKSFDLGDKRESPCLTLKAGRQNTFTQLTLVSDTLRQR